MCIHIYVCEVWEIPSPRHTSFLSLDVWWSWHGMVDNVGCVDCCMLDFVTFFYFRFAFNFSNFPTSFCPTPSFYRSRQALAQPRYKNESKHTSVSLTWNKSDNTHQATSSPPTYQNFRRDVPGRVYLPVFREFSTLSPEHTLFLTLFFTFFRHRQVDS